MRRQRRACVDEGLQFCEQGLAQLLVRLDVGQQHLEAFGHVVIDGRRHLAQVSGRLLDRARQGFALVDIVRTAVGEREVEVVVAAERVAPGKPVDQHRRLGAVARVEAFQHRLVRRHHLLGVDDALGRAGRSRGEEEFRNRVRLDLRLRRVDFRAGGFRQEFFERRRRAGRGRVDPGDDFDVLRNGGLDRRGERRAVGDEDEARRKDRDNGLQLGEIFGDQRIGRRDRRVGDASDHRAEPDQRMVDAVAGENGDRPLDREFSVDKRLRDAAGRMLRGAVRDHAPMSFALPLGKEDTGWSFLRPVVEPVGHRVRMGRKRIGRADDHRAVGASLDGHVRRAEGQFDP